MNPLARRASAGLASCRVGTVMATALVMLWMNRDVVALPVSFRCRPRDGEPCHP